MRQERQVRGADAVTQVKALPRQGGMNGRGRAKKGWSGLMHV